MRPEINGIRQKIINPVLLSLFFLFNPLVSNHPSLASTACSSTTFDESSTVSYVHDGDTLHLKNGRKLRLIGINTPEVSHGEKVAEAFADQAKASLKSLFKNDKSITLIYGREKHDRYHRLLAHAFTGDGNNVQALLLTNGLARSIAFPPNTQFAACYLQQERIARCQKKGLWKNAKNLMAKSLEQSHTGFQLVEGRLNDININKKGIWLNLDNKLTVGIRPDNISLFDTNSLQAMLNKQIVVRGWLNQGKKDRPFYIRIRHPSAIQLHSDFICK